MLPLAGVLQNEFIWKLFSGIGNILDKGARALRALGAWVHLVLLPLIYAGVRMMRSLFNHNSFSAGLDWLVNNGSALFGDGSLGIVTHFSQWLDSDLGEFFGDFFAWLVYAFALDRVFANLLTLVIPAWVIAYVYRIILKLLLRIANIASVGIIDS